MEAFVLSKLEFEDEANSHEGVSYFRVVESLRSCFEEDFAYILEDPKRLREYLVSLLELYFSRIQLKPAYSLAVLWMASEIPIFLYTFVWNGRKQVKVDFALLRVGKNFKELLRKCLLMLLRLKY